MKGRTVVTKIIFVASLAILSSANSFAKDNYFRWTDAQGVVHYGSRPPDNKDAVKVNTFGKSKGTQINDNAPQDTSNKPDTPEQVLKDERATQCKEERKRLSVLTSSGSRVKMQQPDGSTRYLTPEELTKETTASQEFIQQACK